MNVKVYFKISVVSKKDMSGWKHKWTKSVAVNNNRLQAGVYNNEYK